MARAGPELRPCWPVLGAICNVEKAKPQAFMQIGGIDPVKTIQEMLRQMSRDLNLGIGYAVPTSRIAPATPIVNDIID